MRILCTFFILLAIVQPTVAADDPTPRVLLIVDASASMATSFGSEGADRIGAVRSAVDLVTNVLGGFDLDPEPELAIRAYGANLPFTNPVSCTDTTLLLRWTLATDFSPRAVLDDLQPRGQNVLASALQAAADDLGQPGPRDLVIVILDDLDTCGRDAGTAAALLSRQDEGADLLVLGLGLSAIDKFQAADWARFRAPESPTALSADLVGAVAAHLGVTPPTDSVPTRVSLTLPTDGAKGLESVALEGDCVAEPIQVDTLSKKQVFALTLGSASITAADETGEKKIEVIRIPVFPGDALDLDLPPPRETRLEASLTPSSWGQAPQVEVQWGNAPDGPLQVVFAHQDAPPTTWWASMRIEGLEGTITLPLPPLAAPAQVRLQRQIDGAVEVVTRATLDIPGRPITLTAPASILPETVLTVAWDGEASPDDVLTIVPLGAPLELLGDTAAAAAGSPGALIVPPDMCLYEIRYLGGSPYRVLADASIEARTPQAGLLGPAEVPAGRPVEVRWWGPTEPQNAITIAEPDSLATEYLAWGEIEVGSPVLLQAPREPGSLEVRFVSQSDGILASKPLSVTEVIARLTLASTVRIGGRLEVVWEGPAGPDDFLALVPAGQPLNTMLDFAYVSAGSPTSLAVPAKPGTYEVRYIAQDPRRSLAEATFEVPE